MGGGVWGGQATAWPSSTPARFHMGLRDWTPGPSLSLLMNKAFANLVSLQYINYEGLCCYGRKRGS